MNKNIADYALLGNGRTAALVSRGGALEWLCWPRFDSEAQFAALLGDERHGHWTIAPRAKFRSSRAYRPETLVLETRFETEGGAAVLVDFMPVGQPRPCLVRMLRGLHGTLDMRAAFAPKFGNGRSEAQNTRKDGHLEARAQGVELTLACSHPDHAVQDARFEIAAGQEIVYVLGNVPRDPAGFASDALRRCESYWREWSSHCNYDGPWRSAVLRSLITLKALIYEPTGGIVAAPTTSLPELVGGSRNWDYRFCWLRDSTFTVLALLHAGYRDEAREWINWLLDAIAPDEAWIQPVYGVRGNGRLSEYEADWLPGFRGSRPVRFGNEAYRQRQLDIYGDVQDTLHQWRTIGGTLGQSSWKKQLQMLSHLEVNWHEPDAGFWEQRSAPQFFTQSRAQAWVAFDRAIQAVEQFGFDGPVERWKALRSQVHAEVCDKGFSRRLNAFTRSYGSDSFDASVLLLSMVGFVSPDDPRMRSTVEEIGRNLTRDGFVYRYDKERDDDGIGEEEATFLPCCFWYADNFVLQKRYDEAASLFETYLGAANDVGLMSEEYDAVSRIMLGNFPQALTHLALVHTAYNLTGSGPAHSRSGSPVRGGPP